MARLARTASVATLLVAALVLAACGDDNADKNRYIRDLAAAQTTYKANAERIEAGATQTSTPAEDRRTLDRFATAINDTIVALRRLDVPPEAAAEHRRFVGVFMTWRDDIERFVAAIKNPTQAGVARAQRRIAAANLTFNAALRKAGTDIDAALAS